MLAAVLLADNYKEVKKMELENKDLEKGIVVELNKYREFPASRTMQLHKNKVADGFELIPV
ncbi:MAG: hypothetical protein ABFD07_05105, partial [Methanobacterium sp.]